MNQASRKSSLRAQVYAAAYEIFCPSPDCLGGDPIPDPRGSFMWDQIPAKVTCPNCGGEFKVSGKIRSGE